MKLQLANDFCHMRVGLSIVTPGNNWDVHKFLNLRVLELRVSDSKLVAALLTQEPFCTCHGGKCKPHLWTWDTVRITMCRRFCAIRRGAGFKRRVC